MMDYKEAIKVLKNNKPTSDLRQCGKELCTACDVAISAMQELQMYKDNKLCLIPDDVYSKQCEELNEYKQLGTPEEVRKAVEKQKKKKPCASNRCYVCPHCGLITSIRIKHNYCDDCGQRLDWSEQK